MDVTDPASDDDDRPGLLAKVGPSDNSPPLSVSELSGALKRTVESAFGFVRVRGEVSGWKRHASGHCYFTLKDDNACIDAVIWRGQALGLAFQPADGLEGDLGRHLRRLAHRQEVVLGAHRPVLRQVAAGLAHDPHRHPLDRLAAAGAEEEVAHRAGQDSSGAARGRDARPL